MTTKVNKENSILEDIKKALGIAEDLDHFDPEIIMHINSSLMSCNQLGLGPKNGYSIIDKGNIWSEFLGDLENLEGVKTLVFLQVKLAFDTPTNSFLVESVKNQIEELQWRLNVQVVAPLESIDPEG